MRARWLVWHSGVGRWLVEGDAQPDFDVPSGDPDFLDEQPQELLFLAASS